MLTAVALDPGFGNTKICLEGRSAMVQSAVVRPREVGLVAVGMKAAATATQVKFDDFTFSVGAGAWAWGEVRGGMDFSFLSSPERKALMYAALSSLLMPGEVHINMLVIGLPVPLLQDTVQAEAVLNGLKSFKGQHSFQVDQEQYQVTVDRIKVLAQPAGAYFDWLLDDQLHPRKIASQAEVAVLDLGMNTADLYVIQGGLVQPRFVGGGKVGVRRLLQIMMNDGHDLEELDANLRSHKLRPSQVALEGWLSEILAVIERTWPTLKRFTTVIPAGGGALVLGELLQTALASKGAAIHWPSDPICSNVSGLWKWGSYVSNR